MINRFWENLIGRVGGPLNFRLMLQPMMGAILAVRAGLKDAREGSPPYTWDIFTDPVNRGKLLRDGWKAVANVRHLYYHGYHIPSHSSQVVLSIGNSDCGCYLSLAAIYFAPRTGEQNRTTLVPKQQKIAMNCSGCNHHGESL